MKFKFSVSLSSVLDLFELFGQWLSLDLDATLIKHSLNIFAIFLLFIFKTSFPNSKYLLEFNSFLLKQSIMVFQNFLLSAIFFRFRLPKQFFLVSRRRVYKKVSLSFVVIPVFSWSVFIPLIFSLDLNRIAFLSVFFMYGLFLYLRIFFSLWEHIHGKDW